MSLRCQPRDIAYIKGPAPAEYLGRVVEVESLQGVLPEHEILGELWWVKPQGWTPTTCELKDGAFLFPDSLLIPLGGSAGEGETSDVAGLPAPREATPA